MIKKAKEKPIDGLSEEHRIGVMLKRIDSKIDLLIQAQRATIKKLDAKGY